MNQKVYYVYSELEVAMVISGDQQGSLRIIYNFSVDNMNLLSNLILNTNQNFLVKNTQLTNE